MSFTGLNAQNTRLYFNDGPLAQSDFNGEELLINDGKKKVIPDEANIQAVINYHSNGQVAEMGLLVNNKPDGVWRRFDRNGKITSRARYKDGVKRGKWIVRDLDGKLLAKGRYDAKGLKKGVWTYWDSAEQRHYKDQF